MSAEYSVEEVRLQRGRLKSGGYSAADLLHIQRMLTAYAKRIEADERAVTEDIARKAYAALETEGDAIECMRKALLAVWPNPPAQAAQGDLHLGAPAWPGQLEGKAPPEGWVQLSVNNLSEPVAQGEVVFTGLHIDGSPRYERATNPHSPDAADSGRGDGDVIREVIGELRLEAPKRPSAHYLADKLEAALTTQTDAGSCGEKCQRIQHNRDYWYGIAEQYRQELFDATAALAAQGQGEAAVAGYVDPEQVADMQRNGGGVSIGTFGERYGRTVPVYFHPAPAPAPPASPAGVLDGMVLEKMQMLSSTGLFIRTHHAEIAEALKDARRWRHFRRELALGKPDVFAAMNDAIPDDATDTPAVIEPFIDSGIDAAIDAHNSAREVGE